MFRSMSGGVEVLAVSAFRVYWHVVTTTSKLTLFEITSADDVCENVFSRYVINYVCLSWNAFRGMPFVEISKHL